MQKAVWRAMIVLSALTSWAFAQTTSIVSPLPTPTPGLLITPVPEPSSPIMLVIDLLCVAALVFLICRRAPRRDR